MGFRTKEGRSLALRNHGRVACACQLKWKLSIFLKTCITLLVPRGLQAWPFGRLFSCSCRPCPCPQELMMHFGSLAPDISVTLRLSSNYGGPASSSARFWRKERQQQSRCYRHPLAGNSAWPMPSGSGLARNSLFNKAYRVMIISTLSPFCRDGFCLLRSFSCWRASRSVSTKQKIC